MTTGLLLRPVLLLVVVLAAACGGPADTTEMSIARQDTPEAAASPAATPEPANQPRASAESATPAAGDGANGDARSQEQPQSAPSVALHPFMPANGRQRVIMLDPGHGGPEVGAAGAGLAEKDVNLTIAKRLRQLLEADGFRVMLTREGDYRAASQENPQAAGAFPATRFDLQARIDMANAAGADVFVSIHNNGSPLASDSGTEVWWDGKRPWAAYNEALAEQVLGALVSAIRGAGHPTINRGMKEDSDFRVRNGRGFPIFVLGPPRTGVATTRATRMPAMLGETLFLSNPIEARLLGTEAILSAIVRGYREGLLRYFRLIDEGTLALPPGGLPAEQPNYYDQPLPPGGPPNP